MIITDRVAETAAPELEQLAEAALTRIAGDTDEQLAAARWHLAGFTHANNVSMMGGWT